MSVGAWTEVLYTAVFSAEATKTLLRLTTDVVSATPDAARHLAGIEPGWTKASES
ncbi:MAG: hypothetical protein M3Y09_04360 [Actinomycetota bacterium]|nr:hypothetical protein [Actinomycetota bacterium]